MDTAVKPSPDSAVTLGDLLRVSRERGQPLPVAFVVSVFDDILSSAASTAGDGRVGADDVSIDAEGVARMSRPTAVITLAPLLAEALGYEEHVPPAGRALLDRLLAGEPEDRPADGEQLRQWLRQSLGTPAPREEVAALVDAWGLVPAKEGVSTKEQMPLEEPEMPSELITMAPELVEFPAPPDESERPTLVDFPRPAELDRRSKVPEILSDPSADDETDKNPVTGKRRVVRHPPPRSRPISVVAAPAARRSARPRKAHGDSIVVSADENRGWFWVVIVAVSLAALYYFFLA